MTLTLIPVENVTLMLIYGHRISVAGLLSLAVCLLSEWNYPALYFWCHSLPVNSDEWYFLIQQTQPGLDLQSPAMKRKRIILIKHQVGFYQVLSSCLHEFPPNFSPFYFCHRHNACSTCVLQQVHF
jgi:hypothetical protein